ncbi:unnamed protein product [Victoria cruziana]
MGGGGVLKVVLRVEFYCLKCKVAVMKTITRLMGIDSIEIDAEKSTVTVIGEVDPVAVVARVKKVGKRVEIVTVGPPPKVEKVEKKEKEKDEKGDGKKEKCKLPMYCKSCDYISVTVEEYGGCAIM